MGRAENTFKKNVFGNVHLFLFLVCQLVEGRFLKKVSSPKLRFKNLKIS